MRDEQEIRWMLSQFDAAITDDDEINDVTRATWDALCWVLDEDRSDSLVVNYLPKET